jgi:transposase InsO family protein
VSVARSSVHRILGRHGMNRLPANQKHQPHRKRWQRYEKPLPGHRLQLDVKFLERIPGTRTRLYQFTAIDDCTRIRVLKVYDACNQRTAIRFIDEVRCRLPFRIHVIQTDNGAEFQSQFHWHVEALDIRHVYIRPRTPHLNGKVERSHRVDDQEFYQLLDKDGITDDIHLFNEKLRQWEDYYNYHRPHGGARRPDPLRTARGGKRELECQRSLRTLQGLGGGPEQRQLEPDFRMAQTAGCGSPRGLMPMCLVDSS